MPFKIVRNDITKMKVDAVVNTANPRVRVGRGVDESIYTAAGWNRLFKEREKIGPMRRGSAAITPGFDLPAKYIIHTVGPKWDPDDPEPARKQLRDCYDNSLSLALEHGIKSIAFPLISTGSYAFPKEEGLSIAYETISRYLYVSEMDVYLVVYDDEAFSLSQKLMNDIDEFIDSRYIEESKARYGKAEELWASDDMSLRKTGSFDRVTEAYYGKAMPDNRSTLPKARKKRSILRSIIPPKESEKLKKEERINKDEVLYETSGASVEMPMEDIKNSSLAGEETSVNALHQYKSLDELLKNASGETFQDRLYRFIDRSGMSDVEVYKGANLSKQTFSKIKQPGHIPKKRTVLALALSMKLTLDDTRDLLESAGQAFSPSDKIDLTVQFCMDRGIYSIFDVEHILFEKFGETLVS